MMSLKVSLSGISDRRIAGSWKDVVWLSTFIQKTQQISRLEQLNLSGLEEKLAAATDLGFGKRT